MSTPVSHRNKSRGFALPSIGGAAQIPPPRQEILCIGHFLDYRKPLMFKLLIALVSTLLLLLGLPALAAELSGIVTEV